MSNLIETLDPETKRTILNALLSGELTQKDFQYVRAILAGWKPESRVTVRKQNDPIPERDLVAEREHKRRCKVYTLLTGKPIINATVTVYARTK